LHSSNSRQHFNTDFDEHIAGSAGSTVVWHFAASIIAGNLLGVVVTVFLIRSGFAHAATNQRPHRIDVAIPAATRNHCSNSAVDFTLAMSFRSALDGAQQFLFLGAGLAHGSWCS